MAPSEQDITDIFDEASRKGPWRKWPENSYIGKLPLPATFGMRVPFGRLARFGSLLLRGGQFLQSASAAHISEQAARSFIGKSGLYRYQREELIARAARDAVLRADVWRADVKWREERWLSRR